jgi:hypothetical protein
MSSMNVTSATSAAALHRQYAAPATQAAAPPAPAPPPPAPRDADGDHDGDRQSAGHVDVKA